MDSVASVFSSLMSLLQLRSVSITTLVAGGAIYLRMCHFNAPWPNPGRLETNFSNLLGAW